ncbi:MAG TPA: SGNH/GDSL hydrolase family protein [Capsulimonadaceae bacterium]|jgi:lysophospholipase L1-like esterase
MSQIVTATPQHFAHLRDKFVTIVAFGDSITAINHCTHGGHNWTGYLWMGLYEVFPNGFTIINSGIGGNHLAQGLVRLERDVLRFDPDIAIISYGMNDVSSTTPEIFGQQLTEAIRRIREHNACSIILRTPNPMVDMWSGKEQKTVPQDGAMVPRDLAPFAEAIREVSREQDTLLVDHYALWTESMKSPCYGDFLALMHDPVHPNELGHRRLYHEIAPVFNAYRNFFYEWERVLSDQCKVA